MTISPSAQKVQDALQSFGLALEVVELPASTRSAAEAAQAIGCMVAQIAKSVIFRAEQTNRAVLVIASGINRVDVARICAALGEPIGKADADFVRQQTGFVIGGVPPVGHLAQLPTFVDEDLLQYPDIWAAAGTPNAVFNLTPSQLVLITAGQVLKVV
jgi:prolyl-tRNA editing enzyme YbaK/EbsC (Cys-tRNA(Pro) deacylase)